MGKFFTWLYPQVDLCAQCPRNGTCISNVSNLIFTNIKLKNCLYSKPCPLKEIFKHNGFQILYPWKSRHNDKVAAASGSCGKPILEVNESIIAVIKGAIKILQNIIKHPLFVGIFTVLLSLVLAPLLNKLTHSE